MEKCRICLQYRKNLISIFEKVEGTTLSALITSLADVKIREDEVPDGICRSCHKKLTDAYNFKICIERSDMVLQETASCKRISFSNIKDIKVKIEIDCKPLIQEKGNLSNTLFKDGVDCISYKDTVIKRIEKDDDSHSKSFVEFLNSIKSECNNDCEYVAYDIDDNYNTDSGSNYSDTDKLTKCKKKKYVTKNRKKCQTKINNLAKCKPIKPIYLSDLSLVRTGLGRKKKSKDRQTDRRKDQVSVCPYCAKLTKTLNSHILLHIGERSFKCDKCPKAYYKKSVLDKHKKIHTEDRNFKCDRCIAAFIDKATLKSHMLMHQDEKQYICDVCSKAFKRKNSLIRHKLMHNFGNKPVQCELCPLTFNTKYGMRHHMRVHTGERPFKCEICSQPYSYKHDFNRHCLKKHGIFLKRRSVYVMNEEVLQRERAVMKELALRAHGIVKGDTDIPFSGPQAPLAYEQAIKAIEANKVPICF